MPSTRSLRASSDRPTPERWFTRGGSRDQKPPRLVGSATVA